MMYLHIGDGLLRGCLTSTGCLHDVYDHPLDGDLHIGDGHDGFTHQRWLTQRLFDLNLVLA